MFREEIATCEACDLCGSAGAPGEAMSDAPPEVMVIGEAPGYQEHLSHRPFVGQSGQLLRSWLRRCGLENVYITNVIKHWPGLHNPDPTDKQIKACAPFLEREVTNIKPKVIILVGRFAAHLAFKGLMNKLHGRWGYIGDGHGGTPCVAMLHPASVLRRKGKEHPSFEELEGDCLSILIQVAQYVNGYTGATRRPETGQAETLGGTGTGGANPPRLHQPTALDFETSSLDPRSCSVLASATQRGWFPKGDAAGAIEPDHVVMHHACFDAPILARLTYERGLPKRIDDTMLIARDLGHADATLKGLASRVLGEPCRSFNDVAQGRKAEDIPLDELGPYCQRDAELASMLYHTLYHEGDLTAYEQIDRPLIPILARMTLDGGFWVRRGDLGLDGYRVELEEWIADCTIAAHAWGEFNVNSGDQLARKLHHELGLPVLSGKTKAKVRPVVNEKALKKLTLYHPLPSIILDLRGRVKERSTYVLPWLAGGDKVTSIFEFGTETGRLSSHSPNLQNVPKQLRQFLAAEPGHVLVRADYSQIELRVAAHLSQDPAMLSTFRNNGDLHAYTAGQLFGVVNESTRRKAKVFNFGVLLYLGGPENIAEELGVSRAIGARLAQAGRAAFPGYYNWAERTAIEARVRGYTEGLWGRRRYLSFTEDDKHAVRQAVNAPIQGGAADICKRAMNRLECSLRELGGKQVCQVHDEIIAQVPACRAAEAEQLFKEECVKDNLLDVPVEVDVKVSETWADG